MEIYVIRHGETDYNRTGMLQGTTDIPLNQAGIDVAEVTGKAMKGIHFDAAFSSPLKRAIQTAEIILKESGNTCTPVADARIQEINLGDWQGKKTRPGECEVDEARLKEFTTYPDRSYIFPNGESLQMVIDRTQNFLKELSSKNYERVLVLTHGCAMRCMLNFLYEDPQDFWHKKSPMNCSVNILEANNGQIKLMQEDKIYYDPKNVVNLFD